MLFASVGNADAAREGATNQWIYFSLQIIFAFIFFFIITFVITLFFKSIESKQKVFRNISIFLFLFYLIGHFLITYN